MCVYIYYSAIKKNEILPFAITWMDHGDIMLSEISHIEKDKYHTISLICRIKKNELIDTKDRLMIARGGELMGV